MDRQQKQLYHHPQCHQGGTGTQVCEITIASSLSSSSLIWRRGDKASVCMEAWSILESLTVISSHLNSVDRTEGSIWNLISVQCCHHDIISHSYSRALYFPLQGWPTQGRRCSSDDRWEDCGGPEPQGGRSSSGVGPAGCPAGGH